MPFQVSRRLCFIWLGAMGFISSITSDEASSSFHHSLIAAHDDNEVKRQLSTNRTKTSPDQKVKSAVERRLFSPEALFLEHVTNSEGDLRGKVVNWVNVLKGNAATEDATPLFDQIYPVLMMNHDEIEVRALLNHIKQNVRDDNALALGQLYHWEIQDHLSGKAIMGKMIEKDAEGLNILTDPSYLDTWIAFAEDTFIGPPYFNLFLELRSQPDSVLRPDEYDQFVQKALIQTENVELQSAAWMERDALYKKFSNLDLTPDEVFYKLKLDQKPVSLTNPLLRLWAGYPLFLGRRDSVEALFAILSRVYETEPNTLALLILDAAHKKTVPLANRLKTSLIDDWALHEKSKNDVFKLTDGKVYQWVVLRELKEACKRLIRRQRNEFLFKRRT